MINWCKVSLSEQIKIYEEWIKKMNLKYPPIGRGKNLRGNK